MYMYTLHTMYIKIWYYVLIGGYITSLRACMHMPSPAMHDP